MLQLVMMWIPSAFRIAFQPRFRQLAFTRQHYFPCFLWIPKFRRVLWIESYNGFALFSFLVHPSNRHIHRDLLLLTFCFIVPWLFSFQRSSLQTTFGYIILHIPFKNLLVNVSDVCCGHVCESVRLGAIYNNCFSVW